MNLLEVAQKSQKVHEKVMELWNELVPRHRSMAEIAKACGISKSRAYQIIKGRKERTRKK